MHRCRQKALALSDSPILLSTEGDTFEVTATPRIVASAYAAMLTRIPRGTFDTPPRLFVVSSAQGFGGLFASGRIIVGLEDAREIAGRLWTAAIVAHLRRLAPSADPWQFLVYAVLGKITAHELGHALLEVGFEAPYFDEEANADYLAGKLDAARDRDPVIGAAFFREIGCTGAHCTHPRPRERESAYDEGYADQAAG